MKLTFHGAAQEVTGSAHIVTINGKNILLDCGLFQGKRKEAFEKNRNFLVDPDKIDVMLLSHAHMDHSGNIPTLVKKGYKGKIFCTDATADLCQIMFRDCANIQVRDTEYINKKRARQGQKPFEPLYTVEQADIASTHLSPVPYSKPFKLFDNVEVCFHDAGHILGSAFTEINFRETGSTKKLMFTGDIGRRDIPILKDPVVINDIDYLITESTYGDRKHPPAADVKGKLEELVNEICRTKGKMIIPAFSIGRTQLLIYLLNKLHAEGRICPIPVYVDSPLSSAATSVYGKHRECWDPASVEFLVNSSKPFDFGGLRYTESVQESMALNDLPGPMIIISASGMCEAGRILHHLKNNITNPKNIVLIVGYMAENTLGRKIAEHQPEVKIFGMTLPLRARVEEIAALSAHADEFEMLDYFGRCGASHIEHVFCVHGEQNALEFFSDRLVEAGMKNAHIPSPGQVFEL
ncbi:MAG: MBL fold metallo-hydrolase [Planctomycetes bacterium GWC2_45_44]|nr:MAG: MBL fold metallo-hydrolase [Planctomycetes bacterium GWC2_45_44]HBR18733.1 MBL fold metallo-hydrolase [Phycisphaerales bacterium]